MASNNDIGVSLIDEDGDEDLLEYEDDSERDEGASGTADFVNVVSEQDVVKAAELLLQKEAPKVVVNYGQDSFLLFDCNNDDNSDVDQEVVPIILENSKQMHHTCNELFVSIRHFLESYYGKLSFMSKELLFDIPCLDIQLCEDNVYNSQMTFNDIHTIFEILKERSEQLPEADVPSFLEAKITSRPRFVSRYNALVELTQSNATFENIRPFKNDMTHPLIVDDNAAGTPERSEMVVANADETDAPSFTKSRENGENVSADNYNNSDELLEILEDGNNSPGDF